jgi:Na+/proline symporter
MFLMRLAFDLVAAGLLLLGLAYWWLGNAVHELAGTGMFLLVMVHNVFNRRWYGRISKEKRHGRGLFNVGLTLLLLIAMLALLVTSVLISNTLSGFMSAYGGFTVRQIHTLAAYWVLVIVSVHLGLRWPMIIGVARNLFGISKASATRTLTLRATAIVIAIHGVWSSFELGLGTKLAMQTTLDWWNFEEAVLGFFIHCIAITGLYITLTYYGMKWIQHRRDITLSIERGTEIPRRQKADTHSDCSVAASDQQVIG